MSAVQDWTFDGTWPHEPQWFDSPDGRMHYVDVGPRDGRPVILVHGNPTWGYLYRNFIGPLVDAGHRAIVRIISASADRTSPMTGSSIAYPGTPILVFPREIPVTGDGPVVAMTTEIERGLEERFRSKPVHIMWAMKDPAFLAGYLDTLWLKTFPDATVTKLEDAGHYLQEDAHELIVPELVGFVSAL